MNIGVVPNESVPATVYRVLLPREQSRIIVRFHPAVLIKPVAVTLGGLALAGLLSTIIPKINGTFLIVIWLAWLVLLIWLLFRIYEWLDDYFIVTSARLMLVKGVFTKTVNMMPLDKVIDMQFDRSPMGRIFGYGTFLVASAGKDQALSKVEHLPFPEQLYLEVCGLLFNKKLGDDD